MGRDQVTVQGQASQPGPGHAGKAVAGRSHAERQVLGHPELDMKELADQTRAVYAANYGGNPESVVPVKKSWWCFWG